jgi:hypothetical protein
LYNNYKQRSRKNGLDFFLTKEEFSEITKKDCAYCGIYPSQRFKNDQLNGSYVYNGIDRVDSSKGYVLGNVNPCCKVCNKAKLDMPLKEFQEWIDRLVAFQNPESPVIAQGNESNHVLHQITV